MSTNEDVSAQGAIEAVASASASVQLGDQELSVSILTQRFTEGLTWTFRFRFNWVHATPLPITGNETLVLPDALPMSCSNLDIHVVGV